MERVVTVRFRDTSDYRTFPYKTFFEVKPGDYVIVRSRFAGFSIAQVVCPDFPLDKLITDKSNLDYLVQPINDLPYHHYTKKSEKIKEAKALIDNLSAEELGELIQAIKEKYE